MMNVKARPIRWLPAAAPALLAGCIAVPDYSRTETVTRFEAVAIAELQQGRVAYLVNRCTDRLDRLETCSDHGDHGQFLTVQPRGWRIDRRFEPSSGDLTLSDYHGSKYGAYLPPAAGAPAGEGETALGDFIRLEWGANRPHTVRVWWRAGPAAGFRAVTLDAVPGAGAAGQAVKTWPMRPTLVCREVSTEYRIDTVALPLAHTARERKLGVRKEASCAGLP